MDTTTLERFSLNGSEDVVRVRLAVRTWMRANGFTLLQQTKMVTATSEMTRNCVTHGGGGSAELQQLRDGERLGLRLRVADQGPGIADLPLALQGGHSTTGCLGLGLSGSKQLVDDFEITAEPGKGTQVHITQWR